MRTLLAILLGIVALIALILLVVMAVQTVMGLIRRTSVREPASAVVVLAIVFVVTSCSAILAAPGEPPEQSSKGAKEKKDPSANEGTSPPPITTRVPEHSEPPTPSEAPEPTPEPEEEPEPAPEPEPEPEPEVIPNLFPVDVYGNLEDRGFECTGPESVVNDVMWTCDYAELDGSGEYSVEITGPDASSVKQIQAMALTFTTDAPSSTAIELLGFVATVPYEGSEPARARAWVEQNAGSASEVSTVIGGVRYSLSGPVTGRMLQMDPA